MNFQKKHLEKILDYIYNKPNCIVSVKRIREYYDRGSEERSFINFIWRWLRNLESSNVLVLVKNHSANRYKVRDEVRDFLKKNKEKFKIEHFKDEIFRKFGFKD